MKRNGYIDIVKFFFALVIAEFHVNSGLFPGGRLACEVFFMINGLLL
jgi:peptidoglycan/LPS O-acetylase OafA/YrhL